MLAGRSLGERLQATLAKIRPITGVSLAFSGPVDPSGVLLRHFDGPIVGPLSGVRVGLGHGLGGKAASIRRPVVVNDYVRTSHITHDYDRIIQAEGLRAMAAVPVVLSSRTIAVIYAAFRGDQAIGGRIYDAIVNETRSLEHALVVADMLDTVEKPPSEEKIIEENDRLRESLRDTYTQLRLLAVQTTDPTTREELLREAERFTGRGAANEAQISLTDRERDVLALVAGGLSNTQIASVLGLTIHTIKSYMKPLMRKLGAKTRYEAVVNSRRQGLLP